MTGLHLLKASNYTASTLSSLVCTVKIKDNYYYYYCNNSYSSQVIKISWYLHFSWVQSNRS